MNLPYTEYDISITPVTSWTDTSSDYDHIVVNDLFCSGLFIDARIPKDSHNSIAANGPRVKDLVMEKINKETGLIYGDDYIFDNSHKLSNLSNYKSIVIRFKGAEPFTLFKLKYYG